tara:strand:- start:20668 stop:20784 length:117 start_codon:yes stop_codon:yes gene_type:complete
MNKFRSKLIVIVAGLSAFAIVVPLVLSMGLASGSTAGH